MEYMPFVWYYAEDKVWYEQAVQHNANERDRKKQIHISPSEEEISSTIRQHGEICVIAPHLPPKRFENLFTLKELKNTRGALTSQEYELLVKEAEGDKKRFEELYSQLVEEKLGLRVFRPSLTLRDIGGMSGLKQYASVIRAVQNKPALRVKGIFLVGIPGTGKSFSAKCMAGELGRYLVELNLAKIMEHPNPVFALHRVFEHIESLNIPCLLWIDEIEKMFAGESENEKRVFGQLLTIMNDLNTPTGYQIDGIFWVTANNIISIMEKNPELLRRGRFDELFFVDVPSHQDAINIFKIYARKYKLWLGKRAWSDLNSFFKTVVDKIVEMFDDFVAKEGTEIGGRFIYTPAEIEQLSKEIARKERAKKLLTVDIYRGMEEKEAEERIALHGIEEEFLQRVLGKKKEGKSLKRALQELKNEGIVSEQDYEEAAFNLDPIIKAMVAPIRAMRQQSKIFRSAD